MPAGTADDAPNTDGRADAFRAEQAALQAQSDALEAALARLRADPNADPDEVARVTGELAALRERLGRYAALEEQAQHAEVVPDKEDARIFHPEVAVPTVDGGLYTAQGVYSGALGAVDVLFVNGILVELADFLRRLRLIAERWPQATVAGVYNATEDAVHDVWQATNDRAQALLAARVDEGNPAVQRLAEVIAAVGAQTPPHPLKLIAHSQGGAIASAALYLLARTRPELALDFLDVYAVGSFGVDFPAGLRYHFFVHQFDPVPTLARAHLFPQAFRPQVRWRYFGHLTVLEGPKDPQDAHLFATYWDNWDAFLAEEARVQRGGALRRWLGRVAEMAQSELNPWGALLRLRDQLLGRWPRWPV